MGEQKVFVIQSEELRESNHRSKGKAEVLSPAFHFLNRIHTSPLRQELSSILSHDIYQLDFSNDLDFLAECVLE